MKDIGAIRYSAPVERMGKARYHDQKINRPSVFNNIARCVSYREIGWPGDKKTVMLSDPVAAGKRHEQIAVETACSTKFGILSAHHDEVWQLWRWPPNASGGAWSPRVRVAWQAIAVKAARFGLCVEFLASGCHAVEAELSQHVDGRINQHGFVSLMKVIRATQIGVIDNGGWFGEMAAARHLTSPCGSCPSRRVAERDSVTRFVDFCRKPGKLCCISDVKTGMKGQRCKRTPSFELALLLRFELQSSPATEPVGVRADDFT
ncbi:hypothetical protein NKH61_34230 [Mesorhizobium sp. M1005]|uniref:hypothetical protein n=1 Tax=unclassified Mesorhizobium TaxID=325217 RepID=UPI00333DDEC5